MQDINALTSCTTTTFNAAIIRQKKTCQKPAFRRELRSLLHIQDYFLMEADSAVNPDQLRASVQSAVYQALALTPYVPRKPRLVANGLLVATIRSSYYLYQKSAAPGPAEAKPWLLPDAWQTFATKTSSSVTLFCGGQT